MTEEIVVIEFTRKGVPENSQNILFIGLKGSILEDIKNFPGEYEESQTMALQVAKEFGFEYFEQGLALIREGRSKSFKLGPPSKGKTIN